MPNEKTTKSKVMGIIKLLPALQYAFPEILQAFYWIEKETSEEFVHVTWQDQDFRRYDFDINVSCDSVPAMYTDVWNECKRRFL